MCVLDSIRKKKNVRYIKRERVSERKRRKRGRKKEKEECLANDHLPFRMRWERQDVTCQSCLLLPRKLVSSSWLTKFQTPSMMGSMEYEILFSFQNRCPIFMQIEIFFLFSLSLFSSLLFSSSFSFLLFLIDIVITYTRVTFTKKARFACSGNICNVLSTSICVQKGKSCIKVKSK